MKDFNFFSPYLLEKRNRRQKRIYIISVSTLLLIGVFSFIALNLYQIERYNSEINMVESYLNSEKTKELLNKYEETKNETEIINKYYGIVSKIDKILNAQAVVNTSLLDKLSSVMPQDSYLLSMTIINKDMELNYSIKDLVPVAEIEHNLRELNIFDMVHVSIVNAEANYIAKINCSLKDVSIE
ncbi:MAG: hypothetical protein A2Y23_12445 [Clostridiales bacterium GWB2_37_7]|nr:MAG: hypothetical protein A2Y23_12445 [Clostridiales bacterium GWB2_37_7]